MSTASGSSQDRNPVEALADDFLRRQRGGERPTLEDYCRRHPELADEIREVFPVLIRMEEMRSDGPDDSTGGVAVHATTRLERLGDYRILREVGRGGMGVVYEAEQESLGRRVALKVLPDAALSDAQQVQRFQREARAAARLHHTNIVPVFGVGRDDGHHYYVMQFIPGMGLDAVLEELRRLRRGAGSPGPPAGRALSNGAVSAAAVAEAILTGRFSPADGADGAPRPGTTLAATAPAPLVPPASPAPAPAESAVVSLPGASADSLARSDPDRTFFRSVARIGVQVAEALEYANRQGVLHRDVKPSNLLLDPKGNVWVADFGLAKAADAEDITHSGDIVGTVRYMAPERFAGRCDARSDVYALGLTLYELLALRPAFSAADRHELMRRVMSEEPERLRGLVPHVPLDLETIVTKAIDREPARRYPTAATLAEDLQRFLDDKPIKARRVTAAEQGWRWAKRNPAVASLAAGLLLALMAGLAGVTWQWRQAVANLGAAEAANRKAQARFSLAMEAVRAFTTGASEDVILKEKALEGLRRKLLGQSQSFYEKLRVSLEGETDRASRAALAEALFDAGSLYAKVDTPEKALRAYHEVLALRETLARERPSDPTARRELGRSHLALAKSLFSLERLSEASAELGRARGVLQPLVREYPVDGGARLLEAECGHHEGRTLILLGRPDEGRQLLERSKALHEQLIRDDPPYTLATAADGPTEYRRGLAEVLGCLWLDYFREGLSDPSMGLAEELKAVLEPLASGPFANDADRRELASAYGKSGVTLRIFGKIVEGIQDTQRGVVIVRRLVEDSPASTFDKIELADALSDLGVAYADLADRAGTRRYCLESLAILHSLPPEQRTSSKAVLAEISDESWLAENDAVSGQFREAMGHAKQAAALAERWVQSHPESANVHASMGNIWMHLAFIEMSLGLDQEALRDARRVSASLEPILRTNPRLRGLRGDLSAGLLIEAMVALRSRSPVEAAKAADRAATLLEVLSPPPLPREPLFLGGAHAIFYAVGRPAGPNRPADPLGLLAHADRASAGVHEAHRLGYRHPGVTAIVNQLLGGRPDLQLLLMDQRFPADPFRPEPGSDDHESAPDPRGPRS